MDEQRSQPHTPTSPFNSRLQLELKKCESLLASIDDTGEGSIRKGPILKILRRHGIYRDDPRAKDIFDKLDDLEDDSSIDLDLFHKIYSLNPVLIESVFQGKFIIPQFETFTHELKELFNQVKPNEAGQVAQYIPQLKSADPNKFGLAICTIDGQRYSIGDASDLFCIQSCSKPLTYALALELNGEEKVHQHIGREPSGIGFNEVKFNHEKLPHNPMINAGAIMSCSLIKPEFNNAEKFEFVAKFLQRMCGGKPVNFSNPVYLGERATADRNKALSFLMQENKVFPQGNKLKDTLDFYLQCCAIEMNCDAMSIAAATLANAGMCPLNKERTLDSDTVKNVLSLVSSCGMYDYSGQFAFEIGIPAKSGVAGALLVIIPNVMGMAVFSPRLDTHGNSVRGVEFCKRLVAKYNFHVFDSLVRNQKKINPRANRLQTKWGPTEALLYATSQNNVDEICTWIALGASLDCFDYDGRTPLHIAASEGYINLVKFFVAKKIDLNLQDRWHKTPLDSAIEMEQTSIVTYLKIKGAQSGEQISDISQEISQDKEEAQLQKSMTKLPSVRLNRVSHTVSPSSEGKSDKSVSVEKPDSAKTVGFQLSGTSNENLPVEGRQLTAGISHVARHRVPTPPSKVSPKMAQAHAARSRSCIQSMPTQGAKGSRFPKLTTLT